MAGIVHTRQPRYPAKIAATAKRVTHAWGLNVRGPRILYDATGIAHGDFGVGTGGTSGNEWRGYTGGQYVHFDDAGTGGPNSVVLNLGDASGSGAPKSGTRFSVFGRVRFQSVGLQTIYSGAVGSLQIRMLNDGKLDVVKNNFVGVGSSTGVMPAGVDVDFGVSYDGSTVAFYINGRPSGTVSFTQAFVLNQQYKVGAGFNNAERVANGFRLYTLNVCDRVLSAAEFAEVARNPWQIFEAAPSFPYAALAVGDATPTTVDATPGTVTAAGMPASVSLPTVIAAAVGSLAATGLAASVSLGTTVSATLGTVAAAGRAATVILPTVIAVAPGASVATGLAATVSSGSAISATTGTVAAVGQNATIVTPTVVAATLGATSATGLAASVSTGAAISAGVGTVTATGRDATIIAPTVINATTGTSAASGLLASIQSGAAISASTGQIVVTGRSATIVSGVTINCATGAASAAGLSAFIPVATLVSCISGAVTAIGLTASIALDRPAPLPNLHNLYRGLPRNRAYVARARIRTYRGLP